MRRVSAGHYQVEAHGFQYDVIKKEIPVTNWIILKNNERIGPNSVGRYGRAKELVYADIEKESLKKEAENVTDPNMAIQHLDTSGTNAPIGSIAGPANTPYVTFETATPAPNSDLGSQTVMGEAESVHVIDDDEDDDFDDPTLFDDDESE